MLRAHRQAWCWQDEYHGLTIDDIRELERQTQAALQEKMAQALADENGEVPPSAITSSPSKEQVSIYTQTFTRTHMYTHIWIFPLDIFEGVSTPETNWSSSRIEWMNCHKFQWQFVCSIRDECQFVSGVDGAFIPLILLQLLNFSDASQLSLVSRSRKTKGAYRCYGSAAVGEVPLTTVTKATLSPNSAAKEKSLRLQPIEIQTAVQGSPQLKRKFLSLTVWMDPYIFKYVLCFRFLCQFWNPMGISCRKNLQVPSGKMCKWSFFLKNVSHWRWKQNDFCTFFIWRQPVSHAQRKASADGTPRRSIGEFRNLLWGAKLGPWMSNVPCFLSVAKDFKSFAGTSRNIASAVESLEQLQTYDSDEDEFFDAQGLFVCLAFIVCSFIVEDELESSHTTLTNIRCSCSKFGT